MKKFLALIGVFVVMVAIYVIAYFGMMVKFAETEPYPFGLLEKAEVRTVLGVVQVEYVQNPSDDFLRDYDMRENYKYIIQMSRREVEAQIKSALTTAVVLRYNYRKERVEEYLRELLTDRLYKLHFDADWHIPQREDGGPAYADMKKQWRNLGIHFKKIELILY